MIFILTRNKKKTYDSKTLLAYHQGLIDEIRKNSLISEVYQLISCSCRKDAQLFFMTVPLEAFEKINKRFSKVISMKQYTQLITELLWEFLKPKLEEYYGSTINKWYFIGPCIEKNNIYAYSVKFFETSLFKNIGVHNGNMEDKLASIISGYIRDMNGRGPERVTVYIMDNEYLIVSTYGLVPKYVKDYVFKHSDSAYHVENMICTLINEAVEYACHLEKQFISQKFTEIYLQNNHALVLVNIKNKVTE